MRKITGSALPMVLVVSVLVCLLVLFAITLFDLNILFYAGYHSRKQDQDHLNSAVLLYCNDSTFYQELDDTHLLPLYPEDKTSTIQYNRFSWGLYECLCLNLTERGFASARLLGKRVECNKQAALWACDQEMALSLAGKSTIKGALFVPMNGLNYVTIGNEPFTGKHVEESNIAIAQKRAPDIDSTYLKRMEALSLQKDAQFLPEKPRAYYQFDKEEVHYRIGENILEEALRGHLVLHADETVISASTTLQDVILLARKVTIKNGFRGTLQILATDSVIIEDNVRLEYPSGICLKGDSTKTYLTIGETSVLKGYAIVFGRTDTNFSFAVNENYHQAATATVFGLLYVDGVSVLKGNISGAVYLKRCYYVPENGLYSNTLYNTKIYRNNKIAYPFLFQSPYRRREIKSLQ